MKDRDVVQGHSRIYKGGNQILVGKEVPREQRR